MPNTATALDVINYAYRRHNVSPVTQFSMQQEFPYNLALDTLNDMIGIFNLLGSFWFNESITSLSYSPGQSTYSFNTLNIDPKRMIKIRRELTGQYGDLRTMNFRDFQRWYQGNNASPTAPTAYAKYGDTLYLNTVPDQDYSLKVYHYADMPSIVNPTDVFKIPDSDINVIKECCYQMLGFTMGRWDYGTAYQAIVTRVTPLLKSFNSDSSLPSAFPRAF